MTIAGGRNGAGQTGDGGMGEWGDGGMGGHLGLVVVTLMVEPGGLPRRAACPHVPSDRPPRRIRPLVQCRDARGPARGAGRGVAVQLDAIRRRRRRRPWDVQSMGHRQPAGRCWRPDVAVESRHGAVAVGACKQNGARLRWL